MKKSHKLFVASLSVILCIVSLAVFFSVDDASAATCPVCTKPSEQGDCKCPTLDDVCAKCSASDTNDDCKKCPKATCEGCCPECPEVIACGTTCTNSDDCAEAVDGCTICRSGKCTSGNVCGKPCSKLSDCAGGTGGSCAYCNNYISPSMCTEETARCGVTCTANSDCSSAKDGCNTCDPSSLKCTNGKII